MSVPAVRDDDRLPWERRGNEGARAYEAFARYRDLGPARSVAKAARDLGKSSRTLEDWSSKNDWVERAELYDLDVDRRHREARESEMDRLRREEVQIALALQQPALVRLRGDPAKKIPALDPADLDAGDVVTLIREGDRLARLGYGMPTDLTRGIDAWTTAEVSKLARSLVDALLDLIPPDRQHEGVLRVQGVYESWGRR